MKLSAIKQCCAMTNAARVVNDRNGDQWISNLVAMYRVSGVRIDEDAVVELFGLTEKQVGKWILGEERVDNWQLDAYPTEEDVELTEIGRVMLAEATLIVLDGPGGLLMINQDYVRPTRKEYRRYILREDGEQIPKVAVFEGVMCAALICPISEHGNEKIQELAEAIAGRPWLALERGKCAADAEVAAERVAASMGINCDTERGMK